MLEISWSVKKLFVPDPRKMNLIYLSWACIFKYVDFALSGFPQDGEYILRKPAQCFLDIVYEKLKNSKK